MTAGNGSSEPTASAGAGDGAIQIQPTPPAPIIAIPSGSAKRADDATRAERLAGEIRTLDRVLVVLTLTLAFFLASFRAGNSDVWLHLAAGRMIANGEYPFWQAVDPFSHTSDGWDNHAWLSDLILYGVAQAFGGPESSMGGGALVVLKALLVAALAGVLLLIRRPGQGFWIPAMCTALALLAMSPRLFLQPTVVSFLFLGVTLYLLPKPAPLDAAQLAVLPGWRRFLATTQRRWALPVLFALWVNLDGWYLLGPIVVGLYLLGEIVQDRVARIHGGADALAPGELKELGILAAVGFAACLVSPYHIRGLALPPELAAFFSDSMLREDNWFSGFFYSSFDENHLSPANVEMYQNAAVLSFLPLLLLGVISFLCNLRNVRWWRVAVFVPFALLAALWTRAVPFFAVVAAPIMALNFQDMVLAFAARGRAEPNRALVGRLASALALAALLALAWPGLLHPRPDDIRSSRRVCWAVTTNESFRRAAAALADLRQRGILRPGSHAFNLSPDAANFCAWYCPEEKTYFDLRVSPFNDKVISDYVRARVELEYRDLKSASKPANRETALPPDTVFPGVFKKQPIDHVIVTAQEWNQMRKTVLLRFWSDPAQWTMLYADGRTMIFGWNDPARPEAPAFAGADFNPIPLALGPTVEPERGGDELELFSKPPREIADPAASQDWWTWYTKTPEPRPVGLDESAMLRDAYDVRFERREWQFRAAHVVGTSHLSVGPFATQANFAGGITRLTEGYRLSSFPRVPVSAELASTLLLAVRAARQAVKESPEDAQAYFNLAIAIEMLARQQAEMGQGRSASLLEDIRQAQVINSLNRAVLLKPDFAEAHHQLARVYARTSMLGGGVPTHLESHLNHLAKWSDLARDERLRSREPEALLQRQQKQTEDELRRSMIFAAQAVSRLTGVALTEDERRSPEALVRRLRSAYTLKIENQPAHVRLGMALQFGLSEQALEIAREMTQADMDALPENARDYHYYLLILLRIKTGFAHEAQAVESTIKDPPLLVLLTTVNGDYRRTDEHLGDLTARYEQAQRGTMIAMFRTPFMAFHAEPGNLINLAQPARLKREECDARVIRGLMALEHGEPSAARKHFHTALRATLSPVQVPKVMGLFSTTSPLEEIAYIQASQGVSERRFAFELAPLAAGYHRQMEEAAARAGVK